MTIQEIANIIADELNRPFDGFLITRIKKLIILEYNGLIAEQLNKISRYESAYKTQYAVSSLSRVDAVTVGNLEEGKIVLRSTNKLPSPIVLNRPSPFFYVGSVNGRSPFIYTDPSELEFVQELPLIQKATRYSFIDGYLYIYNNLLLQEVMVDCAFESLLINQNDDADTTDGIHYTSDMEFPAPQYLIRKIIEIIPSKYLSITDDKDKIVAGHEDNN